jgi:hypothetical protein
VKIPEILENIKQSHAEYAASPLAEIMRPVTQTWLVVEYIPGSTITEEKILADLAATSEYLSKFIPEEGLELAF